MHSYGVSSYQRFFKLQELNRSQRCFQLLVVLKYILLVSEITMFLKRVIKTENELRLTSCYG